MTTNTVLPERPKVCSACGFSLSHAKGCPTVAALALRPGGEPSVLTASDDAIHALLTELAGVDTHNINLRDHLDAYIAVERFVSALRPVGGADKPAEWQPIETAPKDKTEVLLHRAGHRAIANGYFLPEAYAGNGAWIWPYAYQEPTHWMPLPPSLKEQS